MLALDFSRIATPDQRNALKAAPWGELKDSRVVNVARRLSDGLIAVNDYGPIENLLKPYFESGLPPTLVGSLKALAVLYDLIGQAYIAGRIRNNADSLGSVYCAASGPSTAPAWADRSGPVTAPAWADRSGRDIVAPPSARKGRKPRNVVPAAPVAVQAPVAAPAPAPRTTRPVLRYYDCSKGMQESIKYERALALRNRGYDVHFKKDLRGVKVFDLWYAVQGDALAAAKAADEGPIVGRKYYDLSSGANVQVSYDKAYRMIDQRRVVHFHVAGKEFQIWDPRVDQDRAAKKAARAAAVPA